MTMTSKPNPAGTCLYCGRWWTERAGGVDKNGHCRECRGKIDVEVIKDRIIDKDNE